MFNSETKYRSWIEELLGRLPNVGTVLDVGCGTGVPVARSLTAAGHRVTGVDISDVQVQRARELVPKAEFIRADATALAFPSGTFDAVIPPGASVQGVRDAALNPLALSQPGPGVKRARKNGWSQPYSLSSPSKTSPCRSCHCVTTCPRSKSQSRSQFPSTQPSGRARHSEMIS
ncbi:class I SAM-dependent methyltransferase [Kitasatospora sp. NPDC097691]|uniref:class I SAM-dependent methyltransferase n=1 Tax=Kitasatospora sp. NPDC097691 TaxID=3157231 RepID=UPI00331F35E6